MTFWFRGPGKLTCDFWAGASIPGRRASIPVPQSQAPPKSQVTPRFPAHAPPPGPAPQKSQVTPRKVTSHTSIPGPAAAPPKVTSHCPFSRPRAPKSHKPRPFLPARAPKSHKSRPFLASQKSRLNSRPSPPKVTSHGPFSRPTAPFSRQVTALSPGPTPGPAPQESRLNSRPPAPQESQVTALSPGPAPQKSQVTALSPPTSVLAASRHERPAAHESTFFPGKEAVVREVLGP